MKATLATYGQLSEAEEVHDPSNSTLPIELDLLRKAGITDATEFELQLDDWEPIALNPNNFTVRVYTDDLMIVVFKGHTRVAAMYASFRGHYQAGAHVAINLTVEKNGTASTVPAGGTTYFATNFPPFVDEELPMGPIKPGLLNTWLEQESICGDIARDLVEGKAEDYIANPDSNIANT